MWIYKFSSHRHIPYCLIIRRSYIQTFYYYSLFYVSSFNSKYHVNFWSFLFRLHTYLFFRFLDKVYSQLKSITWVLLKKEGRKMTRYDSYTVRNKLFEFMFRCHVGSWDPRDREVFFQRKGEVLFSGRVAPGDTGGVQTLQGIGACLRRSPQRPLGTPALARRRRLWALLADAAWRGPRNRLLVPSRRPAPSCRRRASLPETSRPCVPGPTVSRSPRRGNWQSDSGESEDQKFVLPT